MADTSRVPIRLVFADRGSFHEIVIRLPAAAIERYDRVIDALREDPEITSTVFVDGRRLVAAYVDAASD
ncbi:MAG: hypothetical protein ACREM1_13155 [Longimicrobiales bacterium]